MAAKPICLVCQVKMAPGFITDLGTDTTDIPRWCAGKPEKQGLTGKARRTQAKAGLPITAFRCPQCEALRLYAPSTQ